MDSTLTKHYLEAIRGGVRPAKGRKARSERECERARRTYSSFLRVKMDDDNDTVIMMATILIIVMYYQSPELNFPSKGSIAF